MDSGARPRAGSPPVLVPAIAAILIAIGIMVVALRPGDAGAGGAPPGDRRQGGAAAPAAEAALPAQGPALRPAQGAPAPAPPAVQPAGDADPFAGSSAHDALCRVRTGYQGPWCASAATAMAASGISARRRTAPSTRTRSPPSAATMPAVRWRAGATSRVRRTPTCQPAPLSQPHIHSKGQLLTCNKRATMHFKRPERWMDAAAAVGIGTVMVVPTCDEKERFAEFQTVLASASHRDRAFLRGASATALFDAMKARVKEVCIDGMPGFACAHFAKLKVVDAELAEAVDADTLRLGNDAGWTGLSGWSGCIWR